MTRNLYCSHFFRQVTDLKKIKIIVVGKIKEEYYRKKIDDFLRETRKSVPIDIIELPDESIPKNPSEVVLKGIKEKEGEKILGQIDNTDYVIALCIEGKLTDSDKLKTIVKSAYESSSGSVVFVIGGSLGLDSRVISRANYRLSFSRMTFPHQMMRVMLMEQIAMINE